uniref:Putative nonfluorescent protein n=1 Tax=Haeckelia beehleri TaxID=140469 RepID=A0A1C8YXN0_9METZ|nr:putative nonfluorescent protein [Haeckelia beehleri]
MDHRMERAESMFTGTAKSKVIAEVQITEGEDIKITGEGFSCPLEGSQNLELNSSTSLPINFNIVGTIIQSNFRMFTQYTGNTVYDFFKTAFPGTMVVELEGSFCDGLSLKGSCTLTYVKDALICRCQLTFDGLTEESLARQDDLSPTLPCFEVIDAGSKADETSSFLSLVWKTSSGERYRCDLRCVVRSVGNFAPSHHFIGHDYRVTEKSTNNLHFTQKVKSRATVINFYKN